MVPMLSLIVSKIEKETPDAVTLTLVPQDGEQVPYQPGQFLTLVLPIRNHEIRRSFSLSSAPGIDKELQITVKRIPNGEISTWMYRHAKVGDVLSSLPPSGRWPNRYRIPLPGNYRARISLVPMLFSISFSPQGSSVQNRCGHYGYVPL